MYCRRQRSVRVCSESSPCAPMCACRVYYTDNYLILVLDYAAGGSLRDLLNKHPKGLDESECRRLFQHLMLAVDFCHKMGVTSRDIKPENLLLGHIEGDPNTQLKLADFGYSKDDTDSIARTKLGTPTHTAPEIMTSPQNQGYDSKRAEVWSCGVTLFELCTGQLPFRHPSDANLKHTQKMAKMMDRITSGAFEFPKDIPLSEQVKDLIRNMLVTGESGLCQLSVYCTNESLLPKPSRFRIYPNKIVMSLCFL